MINNCKRCNTCTHLYCAGYDKMSCEGCPMLIIDNKISGLGRGCGCVAYQFDDNGDCPFYEEDKE